MDYSVVVVNIVEIFAMIGVGFAAGKFGVVSEKLSSELSSLLISVCLLYTSALCSALKC